MACYHPVTAYRSRSGRDSATGSWPITFSKNDGYIDLPVQIPCGKCIGCRLEKSRQWAIRCVQEASLHKENCFITLTYSEEHINRCKNNSLNKEDFVLFMKRLRKKYGSGIRFFHCGEYGEQCGDCGLSKAQCTCKDFKPALGRPHHHACLFNHDFPDKTLWNIREGNKLYRSDDLETLWPYGYCLIGAVTFESAAYVARYIVKKITGDRAASHYEGKEPEYITMSRRPGIASEWWDKYKKDVLAVDKVIVRNDLQIRPPKYYDNKVKAENPHLMERIKYRRSKKLNSADNTPERLAVKEKIKNLKSNKLKRGFENGNH